MHPDNEVFKAEFPKSLMVFTRTQTRSLLSLCSDYVLMAALLKGRQFVVSIV